MLKYIFSLIFLYFFIGFTLFFLQRKIVFNVSGTPNKPSKYGLKDVKEIKIQTSDGIQLLSWFKKPINNKPLLIYFHGNSYDIGERAYRIERYIKDGWGVLLVSWRGFSGNEGKPSENNLYLDALASLNWIKNNTNLKYEEIVLYGESLGCSVAIEVGLKYKFKSSLTKSDPPLRAIPPCGPEL